MPNTIQPLSQAIGWAAGCGLSIVRVEPDGRKILLAFNDTGHLPDHMLTFI